MSEGLMDSLRECLYQRNSNLSKTLRKNCHPHSDVPIINDQGIQAGDDPVAIDKAALDIIESKNPLPDSAAEWLNPGKGLLEKVTMRNPYIHIKTAAELGLGELEYTLIEIERKSKKE